MSMRHGWLGEVCRDGGDGWFHSRRVMTTYFTLMSIRMGIKMRDGDGQGQGRGGGEVAGLMSIVAGLYIYANALIPVQQYLS
jgi:hypothetical protein